MNERCTEWEEGMVGRGGGDGSRGRGEEGVERGECE